MKWRISTFSCMCRVGVFLGIVLTCGGPVLGQPTGACCVTTPNGMQCLIRTQAQCAELNGVYHGDGSACSPTLCGPPPTGACCIAAAGVITCQVLTSAQCAA